MNVEHEFPRGLEEEERERLDELISKSMQLCFDLEFRDVEDAQLVLLKGTTIEDE
tara:strand:- start:216 stop:380 length:165 start_codon:yes stop_codon:yes gene_type:complete